MPLYIPVNSSVWERPRFSKFDTNTKLLFLYFLTSPLMHALSGVYQVRREMVAMHTGLDLKVVEDGIDTLAGHGRIEYDYDNWLVWVVRRFEYVGKKSRQQIVNVLKHLDSMPESYIIDSFRERYADELTIDPKPKPEGIDRVSIGSDTEKGKNREAKGKEEGKTKKPRKKAQITYPPWFEKWWAEYPGPRKAAKEKCCRKWFSDDLEEQGEEQIRILSLHKKYNPDWIRDNGQYTCAPLVYLNQRRWENPPGPSNGNGQRCSLCKEPSMNIVNGLCEVCKRDAEIEAGGYQNTSGREYDQQSPVAVDPRSIS
jgi:hypothetical protein